MARAMRYPFLTPKAQSITKRIILVDDLEKNLVSVCAATGAIGLYYPLVDNKRHLECDEQEAERRFNED